MSQPELVILVDQHDNQLGTEEKLRAHSLGLLHRAFSVFVLREHNGETEVLLQQRAADKYHCGNLWTNTCCSHPRDGEDILAAAERRLVEEMGLHKTLQVIGNFTYRAEFANGLVEHEFDHVLIGYYAGENFTVNTAEVQAHKWISLTALYIDLQQNASAYTPWLKGALNIVQQHINLL